MTIGCIRPGKLLECFGFSSCASVEVKTRVRIKNANEDIMKNANEEGTQLDPELWQGLRQDLLERIVAKLPFSRAVAFRTVCKEWYSDMVPRAVASLEASNRSALLYFYSEESAWWLQVFDAKSDRSRFGKEFELKWFPAARNGEDVRLLICEQGLLFFGFVKRENDVLRDIVVCNPLISMSKSLGLPTPLLASNFGRYTSPRSGCHSIVGVTFDSEAGSYCLVCTGLDEAANHPTLLYPTLLYDSLTSTWTNGPSLLSAFSGEERLNLKQRWLYSNERSFCSNGNLYWYITTRMQHDVCEYVLKFDTRRGSWSQIRNLLVECHDRNFRTFHGATPSGEVLLWHLHRDPVLIKDGPPVLLSYEEHLEPEEVRPPHFIDWPCRSGRHLAPEMKFMPRHVMEKVYRFLNKLQWLSNEKDFNEYMGFYLRGSFYHVVVGPFGLQALVHDTNGNYFTESPAVTPKGFPLEHLRHAKNVWSFSASLTWLP